jgi:hypothetical protein
VKGMSKEFNEGYAAAKDEKATTDDCPYEFDSPEWVRWMNGFEWVSLFDQEGGAS